MDNTVIVIISVVGAFISFVIAFVISLIQIISSKRKLKDVEQKVHDISSKTSIEAEQKKQQILLEAKDDIHRMRVEAEREIKERRFDLSKQEKRLQQKEETIDRKIDNIERKEAEIHKKDQAIIQKGNELNELHKKEIQELEKIASLSTEEAKTILLNKIEGEISYEVGQLLRDYELQLKENSNKSARTILSQAIQRCAVDHVVESSVSVVTLPNDEMKGRIIGREGRNIRTLEAVTGIEFIIDDTPEAVILSGFDPIRREVARISLETLIGDGRIHPTRIEEVVERARKEVEDRIREEGESAVLDAGIQKVHPELIKLLGRLRYRSSYGQNVLQHSKEVAYLAGIMAGELKANVQIAKRAGLLHDIGKAVSYEEEGTHTAIGVDLAKRYGESPKILHAIASHHNDVVPETVEAVLIQVADALSAARPGARRESIELYLKRLEKLEEIACSFKGIEKSYAIQAGREIRIMVQPDSVPDSETLKLARDIAKKIEKELEYPGQVKVTVIRETRTIDYAK